MKINSNKHFKFTSNNKVKVNKSEPFVPRNRERFNFSYLKKGLVILGLAFILHDLSYEKEDIVPISSIDILEDENAYFAEYSLGRVYICQVAEFYKYQQLMRENDILVIDKRSGEDPDMCVYNSCMITDTKIITEVLLILEEYERKVPSMWDRTLSSMYNEWIVHNICYNFNYKVISTQHVDLDNEDESFYSSFIFKLLLKRK